MEIFKRFLDKIEEVVAVSLLAYMLVILTYQIILRFLFNASNSWSEELARYMFVWFVFVTASLAILRNIHIRIDALLGIYPKRLVRHVVILGYIIFLVYCLAVTCYSYQYTMQIKDAEQVSLGLEMPMYLLAMSLPLWHAFMSARIVQMLYRIVVKGENFSPNTQPEETTL